MKRIIEKIELERIDINTVLGNGITTNNNILKEEITKELRDKKEFERLSKIFKK